MYQSKRRSGVHRRRRLVSDSAMLRRPVDLPGLGEPDLVGFGAVRLRHETDEPLSLLGQGVAIRFGQGLERFDLEVGLTPAPLGLPRPADKTVDEHGAGVSGSGIGAPGTSKSSLPVSSWKMLRRPRRRSITSPSRVNPDQVCTSLTVAGPNAPR